MPESIIQIDQNLLETRLDRLITEKMTQILNAMLDAEADEITGAARYERSGGTEGVQGRPLRTQAHRQGRQARAEGAETQGRPVRVRGDRTLPAARAERRGIPDRHVPGGREHPPGRRHQPIAVGRPHASQVVPEKLRTLDHGRPWSDVDWLQCIRQSDEGRMTWDWRPTMADPKHPRHYEESFKRQIVQLYENGKPAREIKDEYDISHSTLHRWVQGIRNSGSTKAADNRTPEQNEPVELRKRNRQLEMEVDVSEQAEPVFARK